MGRLGVEMARLRVFVEGSGLCVESHGDWVTDWLMTAGISDDNLAAGLAACCTGGLGGYELVSRLDIHVCLHAKACTAYTLHVLWVCINMYGLEARAR